MPKLTIDNKEVTVADGTSVLEAARTVGVDIPALCYHRGCTPETSCLCCVVRINGGKRLVPSCATIVADGMAVESETDEIHAARKMALELLLADHAGDCRAPCQNTCPAKMDIPEMIRLINAGKLHEALVVVKEHIALPAALGRVCPELCEKGCRRGQVDHAVSICRLKRYVADVDLALPTPWLPTCKPSTGNRVAIVGSGPAGLAAAWYLLQMGHACTIYDDHDQAGGNLRYAIPAEKLPRDVIDAEVNLIQKLGAQIILKTRIGVDISLGQLQKDFDAVLLAVGEMTPEKAKSLGAPLLGKGLKTDKRTMQTPLPGVFAAGAAVTPYQYAVRAVGEGRSAALLIDQHLKGELPERESTFSVRLGQLDEQELGLYMHDAVLDDRVACCGVEGLSGDQAHTESGRCMNCDCGKLHGCALRKYAIAYGAEAGAYKLERRKVTRTLSHPLVIYEEGKCIQCGLCVQIAGRSREELGLTFIGRGFQVRVGVPFNREMSESLKKVAIEAANACPTCALMVRPGVTIEPERSELSESGRAVASDAGMH